MKKLYQTKSKVIIISIAILLIALSAVLCIFKVQATKTAKSNTNLNAIGEGVNIQSDIYKIEEGYISRILPETTLRDLKNNLDKEEITVTKKDGNVLKDTDFIGTGMKLTYGSKEYKLAVIDDLNGDGKAGITDLTQMKLISVGLRAKPVNEYAKAADINGDGKVSITDLTKSNLASVNLIDIIAPTSFTPEVVSTKDTITVQGETSDSNSGIKEYWFEINNNGWVQNTDKLNIKYTFEGLNMETKYTIRMKAVDKAGNVRVTKRIEIETLNEENANISIVASTEEWTNQNILVAINFNSNVAKEKKQISLDNGNTWVDYTAPITVEKNMTIKARVVNTSGVVLEEQSKQITNIDKLAPKDFKASVTTTDNSMTLSALNAMDADATNEYGKSEIKEYQYEIIQGNMKWAETSENNTFTFNGLNKGDKYRVKVKAIDNAGNEKYAIKLVLEDGTEVDPDTTEIIVRDNTAKYTLTYNANGGAVTPTSVEAKAGEEITLPTPTKQFTVRYSLDEGNTYEQVTITYTFDGWYTSLVGGEAVNYTTMPDEDTEIFAHWTCANPSITLPTPEKEGYEFDGWHTDEELTDKIPDGPYTPTEDVTLYPKWEPTIDTKIEQAGGIRITATPSTENWTNENITVTVTYPEIEGLTKEISIDNGYNWTTYTEAVEVEGNTTVKARMKDSKNQTSTPQELLIDKIDKLAPIAFYIAGETTENTITLRASTADADAQNGSAKSGISGYKFKIDDEPEVVINGESAEHTFEGLTKGQTYKIVVKAVDNAGNETIANNCEDGGMDVIPTSIPDYYGEEVTNYTEGGIKWRVFHKDDEGRIYLIADDYIPYDQLPTTTAGHTLTKGDTDYTAYWNETALNDYSGSAWIRTNTDPKARKWLTWVDTWQSSTNENIKAVAYMMDTDKWSEKFANNDMAEYAIGGPTVELYCASYQVTSTIHHPSIESQNSSIGYEIAYAVTTSPVTGEFKNCNGIYSKSNSNATGNWVASPSAYVGGQKIFSTNSPFSPVYRDYNATEYGFRPIVCIKSGYDLVKNADETGTYKIVDVGEPTLTVTGNTDEWSKNKELTITATDAESGIASVTVNGNRIWPTDGVYIYRAYSNATYTIVATDNAGNTTTKNIGITKIDNTAPTITFSKNSNSTELVTQEVGVTVTEEGSGIAVCKYLWSEDATAPTDESIYSDSTNYCVGDFKDSNTITTKGLAGNYYLHVYMKDNLGNSRTASTTGTFKFRYEITNEEELIQFNNQDIARYNGFEGKTVYLMNDITVSPSAELEVRAFSGTFEGNNHTISGINRHYKQETNYAGGTLFANLRETGKIKNLGITNSTITSDETNSISYTGGIVGSNDGVVENCWFEGTINSNKSIGGIVGVNGSYRSSGNISGIIKNCWFNGNITTTGNAGGIAYENLVGTIENCYTKENSRINAGGRTGGICGWSYGQIIKCYNLADVVGSGDYVGGIVGEISSNSSIQYCYNRGNVTSTCSKDSSYIYVGGIVGDVNYQYDPITISNCYNTGTVTGNVTVGGIIGGTTGNPTIENVYNSGNVYNNSGTSDTFAYTGGIVAYYRGGNINKCYNDGTIGTAKYSGGILGYCPNSNVYESSSTVYNCKYLQGTSSVGVGYGAEWIDGSSAGDVSGKAEVATSLPSILNVVGTNFKSDTGINDGYPILKWQ